MSDPDRFEQSVRSSRALVNGQEVNPWEITIAAAEGSGPAVFQLHLGKAFLRHEFEQTGVEIERDDLQLTVEKSLREHGMNALGAYIGMLRGDYREDHIARGAGLRWLPWFRKPSVKWQCGSWTAVRDEHDVVLVEGSASEV